MSTEAIVSKYGTWQSRCVANGRNYATWNVGSIIDFHRQPLVLVIGKRYSAKTTLMANNIVRDLWPHTRTLRVYSGSEIDNPEWVDLLTAQGIVTSDEKQVHIRSVDSETMLAELKQLCEFQRSRMAQRGQYCPHENMTTVVLDDMLYGQTTQSVEFQKFLLTAPHCNILVICGCQYFHDLSPNLRLNVDWVASANETSVKIRKKMVEVWNVCPDISPLCTTDMMELTHDWRFVVFCCRNKGGILTIRPDGTAADTNHRYKQAKLYAQNCHKFEALLWRTILDEFIPVRDLCDIAAAYVSPDWSSYALHGLYAQQPSAQSLEYMRHMVQITNYQARDDNVVDYEQNRADVERMMSALSTVVHDDGSIIVSSSVSSSSLAAAASSLVAFGVNADDDGDTTFVAPPGGLSVK